MPWNAFVSGTAGWGAFRISPDEGEDVFESDTGSLVAVEMGKEWWIGDAAGAGLVGGVTWHSMPQEGGRTLDRRRLHPQNLHDGELTRGSGFRRRSNLAGQPSST